MENNTWLGSQLTFSWLLMRLGTFSNVCWTFRCLLCVCVCVVCVCVCVLNQSCPTLCNPMDCSPPGSSVHGDSQGKNTRVGCPTSSRQSSEPRDQTQVSRIAGGFFTSWATREAPGFFSEIPIHTVYPFICLVLFLYFLTHGSYILVIFVANIFSPLFWEGVVSFFAFYYMKDRNS